MKNLKQKRSYECVLKCGPRTIKFRNDDVSDGYSNPRFWAQVVLDNLQGIFGSEWHLVRVVDRKAKK